MGCILPSLTFSTSQCPVHNNQCCNLIFFFFEAVSISDDKILLHLGVQSQSQLCSIVDFNLFSHNNEYFVKDSESALASVMGLCILQVKILLDLVLAV